MTDRKLTCVACKSAITKGDIAGSDLEFGGELKATNQPEYTADADTDLVATIGTLDEYTPMVRTVDNQNMSGVKNNTTMMTGQIWGASQIVTWIRLAYSTEGDVAFFGTVIPEKTTGANNSMRFWIIARSSSITFKYQNIFGTLNTDRYAMTYDGSKYELWFHYPVAGTNNRICVNFEGGNQRNFAFDGTTTKETLNPEDYVLYVTPTAVNV